MARISAHGREVGTVQFTTWAKRYMSDGVILKNHGFGWKLGGKLKPGIAPVDAFQRQEAIQRDKLASAPIVAEYRKALHDLAPLGGGRRARLHMTVEMMPDDPDGVWAECCDGCGDNVHADLDDIVELCKLYRAVRLNAKERGL